jgi:hypothetical protein
LWGEFDQIVAAGTMGEIGPTHEDLPTWVATAATACNLQNVVPAGFPKQATDILNAMIVVEGRFHSYQRHDPLAYSSVSIGENSGGTPKHTWTDCGLGFGKLQPYNRGTYNLYKPDENISCMAEFYKPLLQGAPGANASEKVWRSVYKYNHGAYDGDKTIAQLRSSTDPFEKRSAEHADKIFDEMNVTRP